MYTYTRHHRHTRGHEAPHVVVQAEPRLDGGEEEVGEGEVLTTIIIIIIIIIMISIMIITIIL